MNTKLTPEQVQLLDKAVRAASNGDIKSVDGLVKMATKGNKVAKAIALESFDNLTNKIIQQRFTASKLSSMYKVWRQFRDTKLLGYGKEFGKVIPNGMAYPTDAGSTNYVPTQRYDNTPITQTKQNPTMKAFYLTLTGEQLLSKVVSREKMAEMLAYIVNTFEKNIDLYMTDVMYKLIASTNFSVTITDTTSTSAYYCARELGKYLKQAGSFRPDYVIDQTTYSTAYDCLAPEDVIMFISQETMNNFELGLSPVLFNPSKTGFNNLGIGQIIERPSTQYDNTFVSSTHETPTFSTTPYIANNVIVCISKDSLVLLPQLEQMETQRFVNNMTDLYCYNFWYIAAIIGFGLGFKYSGTNLNKTPEESDVTLLSRQAKVAAKESK